MHLQIWRVWHFTLPAAMYNIPHWNKICIWSQNECRGNDGEDKVLAKGKKTFLQANNESSWSDKFLIKINLNQVKVTSTAFVERSLSKLLSEVIYIKYVKHVWKLDFILEWYLTFIFSILRSAGVLDFGWA